MFHDEWSSLKKTGARTAGTPFHFRWLIRRDMPEVLEIERESFEFPWTVDDFVRCLRQRNCIGQVVERDERVVGFVIYELFKSRIELHNFAVAADCRRAGVGFELILRLIGKLSSQRRRRITLKVRETNLGALSFLRAHGFRATGILRGYYNDTEDDAYSLEYCLAERKPSKEPEYTLFKGAK